MIDSRKHGLTAYLCKLIVDVAESGNAIEYANMIEIAHGQFGNSRASVIATFKMIMNILKHVGFSFTNEKGKITVKREVCRGV